MVSLWKLILSCKTGSSIEVTQVTSNICLEREKVAMGTLAVSTTDDTTSCGITKGFVKEGVQIRHLDSSEVHIILDLGERARGHFRAVAST